MNGQEMRLIRAKLGLTQEKFAELLGIAPNSVARHERSEMRISEPVARLARLLSKMARTKEAGNERPSQRAAHPASDEGERLGRRSNLRKRGRK